IVRRYKYGKVPLKAILCSLRPMSHRVIGPHIDITLFTGSTIYTGEIATIVSAVNNIIVPRIDSQVTTFAPCGGFPVALGNRPRIRAMEYSYCRIVLLCTIDAIRKMIVGNNTVELCGRLVVICGPVFTTIKRNLRPSVITDDHPLIVLRRNPQVVMVAV